MTRTLHKTRRQWNRELGQRDRVRRCPICLRELPTDRRFVRVIAGDLQAYDSQACLDESVERDEVKR